MRSGNLDVERSRGLLQFEDDHPEIDMEAELRETFQRSGRHVIDKHEDDMTDQDYYEMDLDQYRACVASEAYDRHEARREDEVRGNPRITKKPENMTAKDYQVMPRKQFSELKISGEYDKHLARNGSKAAQQKLDWKASGYRGGGKQARFPTR